MRNPKPLFVIHAYSLAQARALVAAKVAGETIVVAVSRDWRSPAHGRQRDPHDGALAEVPRRPVTSLRPSGFDPCLRTSRRQFPLTPSTCTR